MRKSSDLRKAEIVDTVLSLADRIGPDRVTTGAVTAEIGITQAALFRHFPTKAALWQAVAASVAEAMTRAWDAALTGHSLPVDRIKAVIAAQLERIAATPALPMLLFSRELNVENAELRMAFAGRLMAFHGHLRREIAAGQQQKALRTDVAPDDAAMLLTSLVQGVAIRWTLGARAFPIRDEGLRMLDVQLRLLATREA
ncbi:TetR family transcriptional regulator [Cereibacter ovatus]|uniref:TetR family transcriptional regulator n=1 Tax=Cereibacter ovatus TaxID=439529 RepID=A0A285D3Z7_9RHOB|nr:TetR/AcrR family transcriptional regulator [Cereibacter ovatus]SNX74530.1 TetR family transcriptional regulator [Cereibacter ovatus]